MREQTLSSFNLPIVNVYIKNCIPKILIRSEVYYPIKYENNVDCCLWLNPFRSIKPLNCY